MTTLPPNPPLHQTFRPGVLTPFWKKLGLWRTLLLSSMAGGILIILFISLWIRQLDVSRLENPLPNPTFVYDTAGNKASQLSSSKIEPVALSEMPQNLKNAIIATEDRRFYEHSGVDFRSIARALVRDLQSGGFAEGGSTITQQLAKNLFLPTDKTLTRKLKEVGYAFKIDFSYSKDEILELYLNSIYFGEGRWGVQGAAKEYFAKNAKDLTLEESALLAGLPKSPSHFSPVKNKDNALERRNVVLSLMKEQKYITAEQYETSKAQPIVLKKANDEQLKGKYASYVDYVMEEAVNLYGFTEDQILTGGLQIYTTLNPVVQTAAQDVFKDDQFFPVSKDDQLIQSGVAIVDQHNGGVQAIAGTRGETIFRGFNHATQLKRQPGSSFKPIAVYGPALELGYTPASILFDAPLTISGYQPRDWDNRTRGLVTMTEAIQKSWNIPAVWLLNEIGIDKGMSFSQKVGIPLEKADHNLSIALGGLSSGVSPLQMSQAFGAFANLGTMYKAHAITKITTRDGLLIIQAQPAATQVISPASAYTMTLLLQNAVKGGNAELNRPTAGKTGTTQLPDTKEFADIGSSSSKDAWFVGYTPELTAAIWVGYDKTDHEHYLTTSGSAIPATLFREIMSRALQAVPVTPFSSPAAIAASNPGKSPTEPNLKKEQPEETHKADNGGGKGKGKNK